MRERERSVARIPVRILDRNYVSRSGTARPYNQTVEKVRYPAVERKNSDNRWRATRGENCDE